MNIEVFSRVLVKSVAVGVYLAILFAFGMYIQLGSNISMEIFFILVAPFYIMLATIPYAVVGLIVEFFNNGKIIEKSFTELRVSYGKIFFLASVVFTFCSWFFFEFGAFVVLTYALCSLFLVEYILPKRFGRNALVTLLWYLFLGVHLLLTVVFVFDF